MGMTHEIAPPSDRAGFAFGLTSEDVEELRTILREECGEEATLEEAWSRAAGLLALTQLLLKHSDLGTPEINVGQLEHRPT